MFSNIGSVYMHIETYGEIRQWGGSYTGGSQTTSDLMLGPECCENGVLLPHMLQHIWNQSDIICKYYMIIRLFVPDSCLYIDVYIYTYIRFNHDCKYVCIQLYIYTYILICLKYVYIYIHTYTSSALCFYVSNHSKPPLPKIQAV